jgi:twitching motility protein PilT
MEHIALTSSLGKLLEWCINQGATDLHAQAYRRYAFRADGKLQRIPPEQFAPPTNDDIVKMLREAFSSSICDRIDMQHEMDLSFICDRLRYRANFSKQQGCQSFSFRVVPQRIPNLDDLRLPSTLAELVAEPRGLLLVTGASGQGKSTTACALLQRLNETMALRIITIEDPIEYLFVEDQCQFEQREVGVDTATFADAIRNAVRQDPEVIFIGEIRDRKTVQTAMQAAETGHLVLATLHADSVPQTLDRIRELHPASEQANASALLARSLNAIICQRLIPSTLGTRVPCLEILTRNSATQEAVAQNDLQLLTGIIEDSVQEGMQRFDQHLIQLIKNQSVTLETARYYAVNWNRLDTEMHGYASSRPGILKRDVQR